ncbi:TPA: lytic transglycosylase, partial [Haemophilus influenzae]
PCAKTAFTGETYGDVVIQLVRVTAERDKCASQVDNIRKFVEKNKKN